MRGFEVKVSDLLSFRKNLRDFGVEGADFVSLR